MNMEIFHIYCDEYRYRENVEKYRDMIFRWYRQALYKCIKCEVLKAAVGQFKGASNPVEFNTF